MRLVLALILLASPASAWEFSASPVCTLTNSDASSTITLTYDPALPEYSITVTRKDGVWPAARYFAMAFTGGNQISIQTDRHQRSDDRRSLTVTDRGFGNVLDGLSFNTTAVAMAGDATVSMSLAGIQPAIDDFRACETTDLLTLAPSQGDDVIQVSTTSG